MTGGNLFRRTGAGLCLLALAGLVPPVQDAAAAAACVSPKGVYASSTPWAQQQLNLAAVAPLSIGAGERVAVIGTGIDPANAQFSTGQVVAGQDLLPSAVRDCDGRGTFAAGIIGAQPDSRTTIVGVSPGAQLVPIRYTQSDDDNSAGGDPARLATAIEDAVADHVQIILVAVPATVGSATLQAAVSHAQRAGILVVSPAAAAKAGQTTYPTSYPGVVAVAGVGPDGAPVTAESGSYVALSAPGKGLAGLAAGAKGKLGHLWPTDDPSFAAAYVAGVLADVASYLPRLGPQQVLQRVLATAGASDGSRTDRLGWGLVDPVRALTAELPADVSPSSMTGPAAPAGRVRLTGAPVGSTPAGRHAGQLTFAGLLLALVIGLGAVTVRRGQRRGWHPERARIKSDPTLRDHWSQL